ncbi:hypothetical protein B0T10DRAFT_585924 [Thelonectria olida]|uniref:BTB domain-containing protein n=1 Tax=Thelonectria olida TaxID=1576542 RepID=A0A9P8VSC5_9HYPO|nr:hypothetical protein B0T10DRAFT_585924 [Thelonectria olida]
MKIDDKSSRSLQDALLLAERGLYSDLRITCGTDEHLVHKVLVCTRSSFLAEACSEPLEVGEKSLIHLPDDDPEAVAAVISYLYRGSYAHPESGAERPSKEQLDAGKWKVSVHGEETASLQEKYLGLHAKVYILAKKYGIQSLKELALNNVRCIRPHITSPHNFVEAAEIAYTSPIPSGSGMRHQVVLGLYQHPSLFDNEALKTLLKRLPDLMYDYILHEYRWRIK